MNELKKVQEEVWVVYKKYCLECKKIETTYEKYEKGLDGFKNYKKRKELTSKMLEEVESIRKKYNIDNLKISMQDLTDFEKKLPIYADKNDKIFHVP